MLTIGTTPLLRAAKALDAPAAKLLVEHGAKLDIPNNRGITPVMAAAGMGSVGRGYSRILHNRRHARRDPSIR